MEMTGFWSRYSQKIFVTFQNAKKTLTTTNRNQQILWSQPMQPLTGKRVM